METMAQLDEMDPDHRSKRGREVIEDTIHEQTIRKEIKELREEMKELREVIKELREEKKELREESRRMEEEIASASGVVRELLEEKLKFVRQQISSRDQQISVLLQEKIRLRSTQEASAEPTQDGSIKWIELMSVIKPALPRNKADVTRVLFPDVQRKLPVTREMYHRSTGVFHAREYLEEADGSQLPAVVSNGLLWKFSDLGLYEMATTLFVGFQLNQFFSLFQELSPHKLKYIMLFNCNEKAGDSYSDVTVEKSRPDTLCMASGRTLLVGEDKVKNLPAAEEDLRNKVKMLPPIYCGELEFILGYVAAGSDFQWVYLGKNGGLDLSLISPCLRLTIFEDRCKFFLSLGYAYHLLCSMVDAVPKVQSKPCFVF